MALCRALTSAAGPVMRDVPVSTMASQPPLHRLSWLPTPILYKIHTGLNPALLVEGGYTRSVLRAVNAFSQASLFKTLNQ